MPKTLVVLPCYNEVQRLSAAQFVSFLEQHDDIDLLPVDDGSTDGTWPALETLAKQCEGRVFPLRLEHNSGKAEAVRRGMLTAFDRSPDFVGFWDADLATPLTEIPSFIEVLVERPEVQLALGSRVAMVGRDIDRSKLRHYVGRIFATYAAKTLKLRVYDTQCGAKLLRNTPRVQNLFKVAFHSTWAFDVELIARLLLEEPSSSAKADAQLWELPLLEWRDVAGSKVKPLDLPRSLHQLYRIRRDYPQLALRD